MVKHKTDIKQTLFFSTMIINILYFLLVVFLIKLSGEEKVVSAIKIDDNLIQ